MTPQAIALTEAGQLTSFAELDQRSSQVARALQRKALSAGGVRPGNRVAYIGASGPEFGEVMYGAAKCRAIFTAVNNRLSARPPRRRRGRRGRRPLRQMGRVPHAAVVLCPGAEVTEADLVAWTRDRLAHFKCPVGVSFTTSLARSASGKLQKQAIRASLSSVAVL